MAKVADLIAKCNESEIFTQNLDENIVEMNAVGKTGLITFMTDPQIILDELRRERKKVGIVIWFPADVFER